MRLSQVGSERRGIGVAVDGSAVGPNPRQSRGLTSVMATFSLRIPHAYASLENAAVADGGLDR
jgi:hypothetical protein